MLGSTVCLCPRIVFLFGGKLLASSVTHTHKKTMHIDFVARITMAKKKETRKKKTIAKFVFRFFLIGNN